MVETTEEYRNRINQLTTSIENEPYIEKMRENIAEGISKTGNRQADIEDQFQEVIDNTTGKDVVAAPELIAARNGKPNLKTRIDDLENETNAHLAHKANLSQLENLAGGAKGAFDTVVDLNTAFPNGTDGIYVVRENGYWYSWNGQTWVIGTLYQKTNTKEVEFLKEDVDRIMDGKIDFTVTNEYVVSPNHPSQTEGKMVATAGYVTTNLLRFKAGDKLEITAGASENVSVLSEWTETGSYLGSRIIGDNSKHLYTYEVTKPYEYLKISNSTSILLLKDLNVKIASSISINDLEKEIEALSSKDTSIPVNSLTARKPVIDFQIDDGNSTDSTFYNIFNNYGFKCGFALKTDTSNFEQYLAYQEEGFEILAHSTDNNPMNDTTLSVEEVEAKFETSKEVLENAGFDVKGWVTPSSELNPIYLDSLKKYYEYATTVYFGTYDGSTGVPQNKLSESTFKLKRVSMESTTIENCKLAIDKVISEGGYLSFYAHNFSKGLTELELNELLTYIKNKVDNEDCLVLKPYDAVKHYYTIRHSDFLALLP